MMQTRYVSTISGNDDGVVAIGGRQVSADLELGEIRDVGKSTFIRSTYAARHNFAVRQYNSYETEENEKKRDMRGGRFFLYNIIIFIFFVATIVLINQMYQNIFLSIPAIVIPTLYVFLTCFNWHIYRTNGCLIHENMIPVSSSSIRSSNKHYVVPVHARIQDREFIAATDGSTTAIVARLQQRYQNLTEVRIMLYKPIYRSRFTRFPCESIIHFLLFLSLLPVSVLMFLAQATDTK